MLRSEGRGPEPMVWLGMEELVNRQLYFIWARNFNVGIWCAERQAFFGIRRKWGRQFVDREFHWSTGAPYGTAKPIAEFPGWHLPVNISFDSDTDNMLSWMRGVEEYCNGKNWPPRR